MKLKPGRDNWEERMNFVVYWANYVKNHSDREWSRQQNVIIDSQIKNARNIKMTVEKYLKLKGEF
mgnify:FL=1